MNRRDSSVSLLPHWLIMPLVAGTLYFALAVLTIAVTSNGHEIAMIWPANALLVAAILQQPCGRWTGVLVAGFLANVAANVLTRGTITGPILFGLSNMLEVFVVSAGLHASFRQDGSLRMSSVLSLLFWAGLVGPGLSSIFGAMTAWFTLEQPFLPAMINWYFSDALGLLVFIPVFYTAFHGRFLAHFRTGTGAVRLETLACCALTLVVAITVFSVSRPPLLFMLFVPITIATFRTGWVGTQFAVMLVVVVGTIAVANGAGPIAVATSDPHKQAFYFQFLLATLLLLHMPVAAALNSRTEALEGLAQSERSTRLIAREAGILMLIVDHHGTCLKAVGAAEQLLGRTETELLGQRLDDISRIVSRNLGSILAEVDIDDGFDQIVEFQSTDDPARWIEAKFGALEVGITGNFDTIVTIQDVTDRKRLELNLTEQAQMDALTGLLNRRGFNEKASRAFTHPQGEGPFLAMIDVDRFKLVNDNLGHEAGDIVLKAIGETLADQVRSSDIIGRLGGDEFAVLLTTPFETQAREVCDRLVRALAIRPVALPNGCDISIAISCGLARYEHGMSLEALKNKADMALYEAKRGGRNQVAVA